MLAEADSVRSSTRLNGIAALAGFAFALPTFVVPESSEWFLAPHICKKDTHWRKSVPVPVRLGAVLSRLVTEHTYSQVSDNFGIRKSTLVKLFEDFIDAIINVLGPLLLRWLWPEETAAVVDAFYRRCGLPNVRGAIDGTHIRIRTPNHSDNPVLYLNGKKFHNSIALQGVCDADGVFLDMSVALPSNWYNDQCLLSFSGLYTQVRSVEAGRNWLGQYAGSVEDFGYVHIFWKTLVMPSPPGYSYLTLRTWS